MRMYRPPPNRNYCPEYPERFINVGIAEAEADDGVAAGLAASGKIPFVNTLCGVLHFAPGSTSFGHRLSRVKR